METLGPATTLIKKPINKQHNNKTNCQKSKSPVQNYENFSYFIEKLPNYLIDKILDNLTTRERIEYLMAVMEEFIVRVEPRGIIFYDLFTDGNDDDDKENIIDHKLANQLQLYLRLGNNGKNFWPIELLEKIDIKNLPKNPEKFLARFAIYEHDICSCCKNEFDEWQLDKSLFYVKELFDKQLEEISISDYSEDDDWDSFSGGEIDWFGESHCGASGIFLPTRQRGRHV